MRILALVSDAYGGRGGIALYNRNVLSALCQQTQVREVVAVPRVVPNPLEPLPDKLRFRDDARDSLPKFLSAIAEELLHNRHFDLVIASHFHLLPAAELARQITRAPLLLLTYGIDAWTPRKRLSNLLVERVDACVSIRQLTLDRLGSWADLSRVPCHILPNAIHLEQYGKGPKRDDLVEKYGLAGKQVLLTLARMDDKDFGFDEVIAAMPQLLQAIPDLVYLAAGSGSRSQELKDKARQLGVDKEVIFCGEVPEAEKADHYRLGDAFAMPGSDPQWFDRYPLRFVFLEAMACGLPVVASRPEELQSDDDSPLPNIYVDPTDADDLIRGVEQALKQGSGAPPEQLNDYSYPTFCKRLQEITDEVLERHRRR